MNKNSIFLFKRSKVFLNKGSGGVSKSDLASVLKNIESLGYTFSKPLINRCRTLSISELTEFYGEVVSNLKKMLGADVDYNPMYPNFPKQVMEASEAELYINAILHYLGDVIGVRIVPEYDKEERLPLLDKTDLKVIDLGTDKEFLSVFTGLVGSNTSLSEKDKEIIAWFVKDQGSKIKDLLPEVIPFKENLTFLAGQIKEEIPSALEVLLPMFKTATDVLRFATALSEGDVSLADKTKYKNFSRGDRKLLLSLLNNVPNPAEDMLRHRTKWVRLGERLHPFEYKKAFPVASEGFKIVRDNSKVKTFNSSLEKLLAANKPYEAAKLLVTRPGVFARKLDHLLRTATRKSSIISQFEEVVSQVSTPVLLQAATHFKSRKDITSKELRSFFPKGNVAKIKVIENTLEAISPKVCKEIVDVCNEALIERFSKLPALGKVYIEGKLSNFLVPFSQRSASDSLRTLVRGSRVPFEDDKGTIRFFLWWTEKANKQKASVGRIDVDLSAVMFDENWKFLEQVSYTNLRSSGYNSCHSGDITSAPKGACEFIDVEISSALKHGARYIMPSVYSFTGQPFDTMPECKAGWMTRDKVQSGEIFDPKTVVDRIDLTSNSKICLPVILDLQDRQAIWMDMSIKSNDRYWWGNNVHSNSANITLVGKAFTKLSKPDLYTLFELHAKARGTRVNSRNKADTIFSVDEGTTPFDLEVIASQFLV